MMFISQFSDFLLLLTNALLDKQRNNSLKPNLGFIKEQGTLHGGLSSYDHVLISIFRCSLLQLNVSQHKDSFVRTHIYTPFNVKKTNKKMSAYHSP